MPTESEALAGNAGLDADIAGGRRLAQFEQKTLVSSFSVEQALQIFMLLRVWIPLSGQVLTPLVWIRRAWIPTLSLSYWNRRHLF